MIRKKVIIKYHDGKTCHKCLRETLAKLKKYYWWPNMKVTTVTNICETYRKMKYDRKPIKPQILVKAISGHLDEDNAIKYD